MQTHKWLLAALLLLYNSAVFSQNLGIGTATPQKKLSVAGSIAVDHDNANIGTLDSAALVFGTDPYPVGISSNKANAAGTSYRGLDLWTGGQRRVSITEYGSVGIGTATPSAKLHVHGSLRAYDVRALGDVTVDGAATIADRLDINGPPPNYSYRFTVNNAHSYFGGQAHFASTITTAGNVSADGYIHADGFVAGFGLRSYANLRADGYAAIGGAVDSNYRLRVWNGNSRFGGDVQITGNLDVDQIKGTGVVRSAGPSSLRMGFHSTSFTLGLGAGGQNDLTEHITDFDGGNNDIRVFVSQFVVDPLPQYANWHEAVFHVHSVDPVSNTCKVRVVNPTNAALQLKGTLYLTSVAKD